VFVCTDIYPAREKPIEGVSGEMIANVTKKLGHKNVHYVADKNEIPNKLMQLKKKDDIIITMGAGDIWKYGEKFVELFKEGKR
jgi:UDP-N-acetylmuramate--alanine ligase